MNIIEKIVVNPAKVRALCIKEDWYTCGTNEEYEVMLTACKVLGNVHKNDFIKNLYDLAVNIYDHSEFDPIHAGCTKSEYITTIMYLISNECTTRLYVDMDEMEEWEKNHG